MASIVRKKYNLLNGKIIGALLLMLMLGGFIMTNATSVSNDTQQFQKLLTKDEMNTLLSTYFDNLNVSTYYNTYNQYNQTYLNQTYIDNNYYVTNNYVNNSLLDNMMNSINNIWQTISQTKDERINIENSSDIINLTGSNCNKIEFMVKDSDIGSVYDNLGLNISTQFSQVNNLNLTNSFFIDNSNNVITNKFNVVYDSLDNNKKAIKTNNDKQMLVSSTNNTNLVGSEILINLALQHFWENNLNEIFVISENNTPKLRLYQQNDNFYLQNLVNNNQIEVSSDSVSNVANVWDNKFGVWKFKINSNNIQVYVENNLVMTLNSMPFSNSINPIALKSHPNTNHYSYFRSVYVNSESMIMTKDEYTLNSINIDYNRYNWLKGEIFILSDSVLYNIGNQIVTQDFPINYTKNNYTLKIDKTRTSISNLYCRK